jgi:hypothetical protein
MNPGTGQVTTLSSGNLLSDPFDLDIEPSGSLVVANGGKIIRVNTTTGAQSVLASGGLIQTTQGIEVNKTNGIIYILDQVPDRLIEVDPITGAQTLLFTDHIFNTERTIACDDQNLIYVNTPTYALNLTTLERVPVPVVTNSTYEQLTVWKGPSVNILSPLESWRHSKFGTGANEGDAADAADPDSDGMPNLVEYATGSDPLTPQTQPWSVSFHEGYSGKELVLTYPQAPIATDTVFYYVEWTDDLTAENWSTTDVWNNWISTANGLKTVEGRAPAGTGDKRFLRLRVVAR